jgi:hypothetical protein
MKRKERFEVQLHASLPPPPVILHLGKKPPVAIDQATGCSSEPNPLYLLIINCRIENIITVLVTVLLSVIVTDQCVLQAASLMEV